jgi:hypothetical protein
MTNFDMIRETVAYKLVLDSGHKHLSEKDYMALSVHICNEAYADDESKASGFNAKMGWWHKLRQALQAALTSDGITVHYDDEYETQFKEWIKTQGDNPGLGPMGKIDWYSQKRAEFDKIYKKEE